MAKASVTLTWQAATDALGDFRFTNVTPGMSQIAVKAEGFKMAERTKLGAFGGRDVADGSYWAGGGECDGHGERSGTGGGGADGE